MMVALGNFFFRFRTTLSPFLLLFLLVPGPALFADPFVAAVLGLIVAACGQVRARHYDRSRVHRARREQTTGSMRTTWSRKGCSSTAAIPLYVGKFLMVLGAGSRRIVGRARWGSAPRISSCTTRSSSRRRRICARKFGAAFDDYCRRVPRWWPRFAGLRRDASQSDFHWARVFVKEYSAPLGWTLPIVAFGLYNMKQVGDLADQPLRTGVLLGVLGCDHALLVDRGLPQEDALAGFSNDRHLSRGCPVSNDADCRTSVRVRGRYLAALARKNSRRDCRSHVAAAAKAGSFTRNAPYAARRASSGSISL